jgi:transposase
VEDSAAVEVERPETRRARRGAQRRGNQALEARALAKVKKNAARRGQTIVFIDESGLSERPHRCRTWAPRGQTPVLQYHFNWKTLSVIAGVTWWNFYFRLYPGAIRAPQVVDFLGRLLRQLPGPLLVIWDGLPVHRSCRVRDFVAKHRQRLELERLPAYAPELNPPEYLWGYLKKHAIPNLCPKNLTELSSAARRALGRIRRRPALITAFWQQAELF